MRLCGENCFSVLMQPAMRRKDGEILDIENYSRATVFQGKKARIIASNVKGWAGNWDAIYDNILLRAKIKNEIVNTANKIKDYKILEAEFNTKANHAFHRISDKIREEIGLPLGDRVFPEWQKWLNSEIKGKKI